MPMLVAAGALVAVPALLRLVPAGTLRARAGVPATVLARGVQTFAFFGTDAFVPLAIQEVRHQSVTYTGIVLTVSTLSWTATSWVHAALRPPAAGRGCSSGSGSRASPFGIVGVAAALSPSVPVWTIAITLEHRRRGHGVLVLAAVGRRARRGRARSGGRGERVDPALGPARASHWAPGSRARRSPSVRWSAGSRRTACWWARRSRGPWPSPGSSSRAGCRGGSPMPRAHRGRSRRSSRSVERPDPTPHR